MKEQPQLEVYELPTDQLVPYANNAKIHSALQVEQIANSIQEFGFNDPIAVWENEKGEPEIVEGHGRVLAAKKLGIDKLPVIYLNHLSDEARRAYTHIHNQTVLNSGFDMAVLEVDIDSLDYDWEDFGFDVSELVDDVAVANEIDDEINREVEGEVKFAKYIDEESNYVVLKFRTKKDWLQAQSVFNLERVSSWSTRTDGGENGAMRLGVGRVIDGREAISRLMELGRELHD